MCRVNSRAVDTPSRHGIGRGGKVARGPGDGDRCRYARLSAVVGNEVGQNPRCIPCNDTWDEQEQWHDCRRELGPVQEPEKWFRRGAPRRRRPRRVMDRTIQEDALCGKRTRPVSCSTRPGGSAALWTPMPTSQRTSALANTTA